MKLRWWVIGAVAVTVGSIFVLKQLGENKEKPSAHFDGNNENNLNGVSPDVAETDFEEIDFLS